MARITKKVDVRDIVARTLFSAQYRLRSFDRSRPFLRQLFYKKAEEAIRRAQVENVVVVKDVPSPVELVDKETGHGLV